MEIVRHGNNSMRCSGRNNNSGLEAEQLGLSRRLTSGLNLVPNVSRSPGANKGRGCQEAPLSPPETLLREIYKN